MKVARTIPFVHFQSVECRFSFNSWGPRGVRNKTCLPLHGFSALRCSAKLENVSLVGFTLRFTNRPVQTLFVPEIFTEMSYFQRNTLHENARKSKQKKKRKREERKETDKTKKRTGFLFYLLGVSFRLHLDLLRGKNE